MTTSGYSLRRISGPDLEPVTLAEAKAHCRVEIDTDDTLIESLIAAARQYCEDWTRRTFVESEWEMRMQALPACGFEVPRPPVIGVDSIRYIDSAGDWQDLPVEDWTVDLDASPARVAPVYGHYWPWAQTQPGSVLVTFRAGYPAAGSPTDAANVPAAIKVAILQCVGHWYENRETVNVGGGIPAEVPLTVESLLSPYRVYTY